MNFCTQKQAAVFNVTGLDHNATVKEMCRLACLSMGVVSTAVIQELVGLKNKTHLGEERKERKERAAKTKEERKERAAAAAKTKEEKAKAKEEKRAYWDKKAEEFKRKHEGLRALEEHSTEDAQDQLVGGRGRHAPGLAQVRPPPVQFFPSCAGARLLRAWQVKLLKQAQ